MAAAQCLSQYSPTPHPILPGKTPRNFKPRTAPAVLQYKPTQAQCAVSDKRNLSVARTCFDHAGPSSGRKSKLWIVNYLGVRLQATALSQLSSYSPWWWPGVVETCARNIIYTCVWCMWCVCCMCVCMCVCCAVLFVCGVCVCVCVCVCLCCAVLCVCGVWCVCLVCVRVMCGVCVCVLRNTFGVLVFIVELRMSKHTDTRLQDKSCDVPNKMNAEQRDTLKSPFRNSDPPCFSSSSAIRTQRAKTNVSPSDRLCPAVTIRIACSLPHCSEL